jgi:hypothetical protein
MNFRAALLAFSPALAMFANVVLAGDSDSYRHYEVRDTVEMSYFGTIAASTSVDLDDDAISSPDGHHFLKVTHRGVLPQGVTEGTIWLFDTKAIQKSVNDPRLVPAPPVALVRMSTAANGAYGLDILDAGNAITEVRWSDDSRSATFLGRDGRNNRQLFNVRLDSLKVDAITPPTQDIIAYSRSGNSFAYLVGPDADLQAEQAWVSAGPGIPDIVIGTGTPLMPLLFPHFQGNALAEPVDLELWQVRDNRVSPVVDNATKKALKIVSQYSALALTLSPDATKVVTIAENSPPSQADQANAALRYSSIDLKTGAKSVLVDSPIADTQWARAGRYRAAWSPKGGEIALTEVMLPTRSDGPKERTLCTVALVNIITHEVRCVARPDARSAGVIHSLDWGPSGETIRLNYRTAGNQAYTEVTLRRHGLKWIAEKDHY